MSMEVTFVPNKIVAPAVLFWNLLAIAVFNNLMTTAYQESDQEQLMTAIRQKDRQAVERILENGDVELDPPTKLHSVNKPLAYAAAYGNLEIVKVLVEAGSDLDGKVAYFDVPLIKALEHGNDDVIEYLIREGASVNAPNAFGVTPLVGLCAYGKLELTKLAVQNGGNIHSSYYVQVGESRGKKNQTPLQAAVYWGHLEVVEYLLGQGADPTAVDSDGRDALQIAISQEHKEISRLLNASMVDRR